MMTITECPPIERLRDLTLGRLGEDDSDLLLDHLRDCQGCQLELDTIGAEDGFRMHDILDGLSNTLLVMETESSVPWTKPQDLNEVPEFAGDAILRYVTADGSVRTMDPVDLEKLKAMITRDGGCLLYTSPSPRD